MFRSLTLVQEFNISKKKAELEVFQFELGSLQTVTEGKGRDTLKQ